MTEYCYQWGNNSKRKTLKGRECTILSKGTKNSILIQFTDNKQKECVSRYSVRIIKPTNQTMLKL